jgi:hypothetical protein
MSLVALPLEIKIVQSSPNDLVHSYLAYSINPCRLKVYGAGRLLMKPKTNDGRIKLLGAGWLGLGGIFLALAFVAFLSVVIGDDPAGQAFESGDKWWIVVLVLLALGAIPMVNGLALLRRNTKARPLIAVSSLVLLIPSIGGAATFFGIPLLLVVVASLWLTFSRRGREAFASYTAREKG